MPSCHASQASTFSSAARLSHNASWGLPVNQSTGCPLSIHMLQYPMPDHYFFGIHISLFAII